MSIRIPNGIRNISKKALEGINSTGRQVRGLAKRAYINSDEFIKNHKLNKTPKVDKNTLIGSGTLLAALMLSVKCIKGIGNKITEIKNNK